MASDSESPPPIDLGPVERRVLGTLIEKGLTTPDQYPLTLNALVAGCNQKSNRDPVTQYDETQIDGALQSLIGRGLVANATGFSGRAERFSSQMGRAFELRSAEVAVLGELLLRGPQTEGELRIRASRMRPIADLPALHEILAKLRSFTPPLVVRLGPEGSTRGVRHTHAFCPKAELDSILAAEPERGAGAKESAPPPPGEVEALRARVAALEEKFAALERRLGERGAASPGEGG